MYMYEGNFSQGQRSGTGTAYWVNHEYSKCKWRNGDIVSEIERGTWR